MSRKKSGKRATRSKPQNGDAPHTKTLSERLQILVAKPALKRHLIGLGAGAAMALVAVIVLVLQFNLSRQMDHSKFSYDLQLNEKKGVEIVWKDSRTPVSAVQATLQPNATPVQEVISQEKDLIFDSAVAAVNRNEWVDAERLLSEVTKRPTPPMLSHYLYGYTLRRLNRPKEAIRAYETYLSLSPTSKFKFSAAVELAFLLLPEPNVGALKAEQIAAPTLESYGAIADERVRSLAIQGLKAIYKGRAIEEGRLQHAERVADYQKKLKDLKEAR